MKVLIIGANGKIGRLLSKGLSVSKSYEPTVFIRNDEQRSYFNEIGVPVIVESLESSEEVIENIVKDFDAIVFTAGSGGQTGYDKTLEIDLDGAIKVINAAKNKNVKRFVMVSAAHADDREFWEQSSIKPYYIAKHYADKELTRSNLDYTILRPVRLSDDTKAGKVEMLNEPSLLEREIPRVAVAETIMAVLGNEATYKKTIEMSSGKYSIAEALKRYTDQN